MCFRHVRRIETASRRRDAARYAEQSSTRRKSTQSSQIPYFPPGSPTGLIDDRLGVPLLALHLDQLQRATQTTRPKFSSSTTFVKGIDCDSDLEILLHSLRYDTIDTRLRTIDNGLYTSSEPGVYRIPPVSTTRLVLQGIDLHLLRLAFD